MQLQQLSEHPTVAELTTVTTSLSGYHLLADPLLNKGTAFTEAERDMFDLHGLLPPNIGVLDEQLSRRLQALRNFKTDLERYSAGIHARFDSFNIVASTVGLNRSLSAEQAAPLLAGAPCRWHTGLRPR